MPERRNETGSRQLLGWSFRDEPLLAQALAHRSWCAEHPEASRPTSGSSSSATPCSGSSSPTTSSGPTRCCQEGHLAKVRASVVNADVLAEVARQASSSAPACASARARTRPAAGPKTSILSDAMEAIIAAVYLDGGLEAARTVVMKLFGERIADAASGPGGDDYKTRLQELAAQRFEKLPRYQVVRRGPGSRQAVLRDGADRRRAARRG